MSLSILVAQERWQEFDDAWKEQMTAQAPVDDLLVALRIAGDKNRISRCVQSGREHAELLQAADRHGDAAQVLGALIVSGANTGEFAKDLLSCAETAWASESWWSKYGELTGLIGENADIRAAWKSFATLCRFQPDRFVFHPGGWGAGQVLETRPDDLEVVVRFWNGRQDTFPMNAAIEIFEPLPETDIRALHYADPEGLRKRAKAEPLEVLRAIVERHNGRVTTNAIRTALMQIGIEGSAWTAWWRKARKLAENSEWFDVSGSAQKAVIQLLLTAKDPLEALRKQLGQASSLADMHGRVRDLFIGQKVGPELETLALEMLEEAANDATEPPEERVAAWLLVRERRESTPQNLLDMVAELRQAEVPADPSVAPPMWAAFQLLPGVRDQERAFELVREALGDEWVEEAVRHLPHAPHGMVRVIVDALGQAGRQKDLIQHYAGLLARPQRAPTLLVHLARMLEKEGLEGDLPTPVQRAQALLSLAHNLSETRRGDAQLTRVHTRLVDTLTSGKKPLLRRLLGDVDVAGMRSLQVQIQRGVDDAIDHLVTDIALELDRHFFAGDVGPFWKGDTIWTTRAGLERRSRELKVLREVKIPENQDAIGRAAAYGDLSENAEWEAAMEEQRKLTGRAMEIEEELRKADLIENAVQPEGVVCPGSHVSYREVDSGEEQRITILGPWDATNERPEIVSYRAPLAAGLLGLKVGEKATVTLPSGTLDVEVLAIDSADDL